MQSRKWKDSSEWKEVFANHGTDKDLVSKIHKQPLQFNHKKTKEKKNIYMI
jgi:hypothetical protein